MEMLFKIIGAIIQSDDLVRPVGKGITPSSAIQNAPLLVFVLTKEWPERRIAVDD
jgi:hypothetical protein